METVSAMRGVLGGFKNMLRQWRINYLRNKKKKQQEIEAGKLAKYYTLKRILYSGLAIACYPFGLFHTPSKTVIEEYPDLTKIKENIMILQKKQEPSKKKKEIQKIEKQIQKLERKMSKTLPAKTDSIQKEASIILQELKKEIFNVKNSVPIKTKETTISRNVNKHVFNENSASASIPNVDKEDKAVKVDFSPLESVAKVALIDSKIEKEKVGKLAEEISNLSHKIETAKEYNLFYDYTKKLNDCKRQLEEMLESLEKAGFMRLLSNLEEQERKKPIVELLEEVKQLEILIQDKKYQLYHETTVSNEKKETVAKETQKKVEEQKKQQSSISEWQQAQMLILKQIEQQQNQLLNFEKKRTKLGKKGLLQTLMGLASHTIGLLVSFSPFALFKNKLLGTLATTIMVNNSLRSMKRVLHPEEAINYEWLGQELKEKQALLENIYRIGMNSLYQISSIKEEMQLLLKNDAENMEILSFLKQLEMIEEQTVRINERVKRDGKILDKQYTKVFTKQYTNK